MTTTKTRYGGVAGPQTNWGRDVEVSYEFQTGIFTSRNGREQRWAQRQTARMTLSHDAVFRQAGVTRLQADIASGQAGSIFVVPGEFRHVTLAADAAISAGSITVDDAAFWIADGASLVIENSTTQEAVRVASVAGPVVTLEDPLNAAFLTGSKVYHGFRARMQDKTSLRAPTAGVWTGFFTWEVDPGSDPQAVPAASPTLFEDVEVFLTRPNYREAPRLEFEAMQEIMDVGRGLISVDSPWSFNPLTEQLLFTGRTRTQAEDLIGFFLRQKGQRDSFWMPTWTRDFVALQAESSGSFDVTIAGSDFRTAFSGSETFNVVAAIWPDGTVQLNRVASMALDVDDTVVTFDDAWDEAITTSTLFSWCPRFRFSTDTLEVRWMSDEVAEMQFNVRQIPNDAPA